MGLQLPRAGPERRCVLAGIQAQELDTEATIDYDNLPVLYLPVDKSVEIKIEARDVLHSFCVVDFLYKKDMIPGKTQLHVLHATKTGTYIGKCAELCGEYHSLMLFQVKVVRSRVRRIHPSQADLGRRASWAATST